MKDFDEQIINGTAYEYHKKAIYKNDCKWFVVLLLTIGITIGMMENRKPIIIDNSKEVAQYCDSLQNFVDTSLYVKGFLGK